MELCVLYRSSSSNVVVRETRHGSSFRVVTSAEAKPQPSLVFRHNSQWNGGYPGLGKVRLVAYSIVELVDLEAYRLAVE